MVQVRRTNEGQPIIDEGALVMQRTDLRIVDPDPHPGFEQIPVCVAYDVDGVRSDEVPMTQTEFHHAKPIYENLPGWTEDISGAKSLADLPKNARDYVAFLEEISKTRISAVGVGQDRNATIAIHDLIH
jgi:adenylosuccinate synthase